MSPPSGELAKPNPVVASESRIVPLDSLTHKSTEYGVLTELPAYGYEMYWLFELVCHHIGMYPE
jgi:hypothetical protein